MDTTQFELIDPRPISGERYLEIAKWHDCMYPNGQSSPQEEEEWFRVNDLINALAHALTRLAMPGYPLGLSRADVLDAACEVYSWRKREGEIMRSLLHMVDDRDQQVFATAIESEELRARLSTVEAANAELKQELAEQEREKLALVQELNAYRLVRQGMETKWHAILREVMAPMPDFDEAVRRAGAGADSQLPFNPGFTPKCHGCGLEANARRCTTADCPAKAHFQAAAALPTTGEGAEPARRQTVSNIMGPDGTPLVFTKGNHWNE